ncbi:MAG: hypothetical protein KJP14_04305 [Eudoraea sp.]|nr:hypothetical protein [Eudoraea sp.]NNK30514.1 hypothetical protein [Flavobacteriaceae bacterium]MBT8205308.1 hypothetical protein [Eudoraea sp.]MBT8209728.1 hypothetical protein [Eudoraea sp.]MBT8311548.1 hypothetical protein [Eudoraea sp.]
MTYKLKSLIYFLGLLLAIMLYYTTDTDSNSMEQQTQEQIADNDIKPIDRKLDFK